MQTEMEANMNTRAPGKAAYRLLKHKLQDEMIEYTELAEMLGKSMTYVSERMRGIKTFTIDEGYQILRLLHLPEEWMVVIFPSDPFVSPKDQHVRIA